MNRWRLDRDGRLNEEVAILRLDRGNVGYWLDIGLCNLL